MKDSRHPSDRTCTSHDKTTPVRQVWTKHNNLQMVEQMILPQPHDLTRCITCLWQHMTNVAIVVEQRAMYCSANFQDVHSCQPGRMWLLATAVQRVLYLMCSLLH